MTGLETFAVAAAAVWLALLSLVLVLVVRQLGILTVRLDATSPVTARSDDGPEIGSDLPQEAAAVLADVRDGVRYLVLMAATCRPCRELAAELGERDLDARFLALVPGREQLADGLISLLPAQLRVIRDPVATEVAESLGITSTPFAVEVEDGKVSGKAYVSNAADLDRLVEARGRRIPLAVVAD